MKQLSKERLAKTRILTVGDVILDRYWYGAVDRISPEAPVPVVKVNKNEYRIGGAANVANNIAHFGAHAALLSVIGVDESGEILEKLTLASGIHTYFRKDPDFETTVKLRIIGKSQQLLRLDFEGTPKKEMLENQNSIFNDIAKDFNAILFSDYGKGGLVHINKMIALANENGIPIFVDPKGCDYSCYKNATVITPNKKELQAVIGSWKNEEELITKAQNLRGQLNLTGILLTRSEEGMTLFDASSVTHVNAVAREVFDVTGAGDTVIAILTTLVAAGLTLKEAMPLANKAAGLVVGKFGTASISYDELFSY